MKVGPIDSSNVSPDKRIRFQKMVWDVLVMQNEFEAVESQSSEYSGPRSETAAGHVPGPAARTVNHFPEQNATSGNDGKRSRGPGRSIIPVIFPIRKLTVESISLPDTEHDNIERLETWFELTRVLLEHFPLSEHLVLNLKAIVEGVNASWFARYMMSRAIITFPDELKEIMGIASTLLRRSREQNKEDDERKEKKTEEEEQRDKEERQRQCRSYTANSFMALLLWWGCTSPAQINSFARMISGQIEEREDNARRSLQCEFRNAMNTGSKVKTVTVTPTKATAPSTIRGVSRGTDEPLKGSAATVTTAKTMTGETRAGTDATTTTGAETRTRASTSADDKGKGGEPSIGNVTGEEKGDNRACSCDGGCDTFDFKSEISRGLDEVSLLRRRLASIFSIEIEALKDIVKQKEGIHWEDDNVRRTRKFKSWTAEDDDGDTEAED